MSLLTNLWFPNGAAVTDFAGLTAYGAQYVPSPAVMADPEIAARVEVMTAPYGLSEQVCRLTHFAADSAINAYGYKTQLTPAFTGALRDPISNWAGYSASRRWYRFKFMLPADWIWERWNNGSQRCVVFQVHDTIDTSPADTDSSPPLWVITYPDGTFHVDVTSCSAAQKTSSNFTVRSATILRPTPGVPMEVVIYAKWAYDTTGALKIWVDRRLHFEETGAANCSNDDPARGGSGLFANLDLYSKDSPNDQTVYHWGIQIGDESYANYAAFAAACGAGSELERPVASLSCFM